MGISRKPRTQQRTAACLVFLVSGYRKRPQSTSGKLRLLEIFRRNVEIQLGKTSRRTSRGFLQTGIQRKWMGKYSCTRKLEYPWHTKRWFAEIRCAHLCQSTGNFPAQSGCRRLARWRNAYTTNQLDNIRIPQRSRFVPA